MKVLLKTAAAVAICAGLSSMSFAQDATTKGPPKTMGDEGKLPATGTMSGRTPEMGGTGAGAGTGGATGDNQPSTRKGPPKRMGDEGKLPATGNMSGATPRMNPPVEKGN